ncbi:MAG: AAA family ATPase [Solirubrobacterales bacterium]
MAAHPTPVLILTGPPGVGKATSAGILSRRSDPAVHLESDAFFRFISAGFVEPWKPESEDQNRLVMGIVGDAAAAYARAGYFTIVDGIVIPRWFLTPLREALAAAGLAVAYCVLRAPLPTCTARVDAREGGPLADPGVIQRLWTDFADLGELERHVVDVTDQNPEQAAAAIARRLDDGTLTL